MFVEQIPSNTQKSSKTALLVMVFGIILVLVAFSIWYFFLYKGEQMNPQAPSNTTSEERARILAEMDAATKNTPPLSAEERARILAEMDAATKNPPPLTAEERARIISELSNQSQ